MCLGSEPVHVWSFVNKHSDITMVTYPVFRPIPFRHQVFRYRVERRGCDNMQYISVPMQQPSRCFLLFLGHFDRSSRQSIRICLRDLGTTYPVKGVMTTMTVVYAFGVVLLQLLTGFKTIDETRSIENVHLGMWCQDLGDIFGLIDVTIAQSDREIEESIVRVAALPLKCTACEPHERPDMGVVVDLLRPLVREEEEAVTTSAGESTSTFVGRF